MKKRAYIKPSFRMTTMAPTQLVCVSGGIESNTITIHDDVTVEDVW